MIKTSLNFCNNKQCKRISLWINKKSMLFRFLTSLGFNEILTETYFCVKTLNKIDHIINHQEFDNWHITMSDSDVY